MKQIRATELNQQIQAVMQTEDWQTAIALVQNHSEIVQTHWELSWNLGWSYFKLDRFKDARGHLLRATKLAPDNFACHWALGTVYRCLRNYKKAETSLLKSLSIKDSHIARIALALTYLEQGRVDEAEEVHLEGLRLEPNKGERYESYGAFLLDVGREEEAQQMSRKARNLKRKKKMGQGHRV